MKTKNKNVLAICFILFVFTFCSSDFVFAQSPQSQQSSQSSQASYMLIFQILAAITSIGTCGIVIFLFRRLFTNQDILSTLIKELTDLLAAFKLQVATGYIQVASCQSHQKKCDERISRLEVKVDKNVGDITRLNTILEIKNKK